MIELRLRWLTLSVQALNIPILGRNHICQRVHCLLALWLFKLVLFLLARTVKPPKVGFTSYQLVSCSGIPYVSISPKARASFIPLRVGVCSPSNGHESLFYFAEHLLFFHFLLFQLCPFFFFLYKDHWSCINLSLLEIGIFLFSWSNTIKIWLRSTNKIF